MQDEVWGFLMEFEEMRQCCKDSFTPRLQRSPTSGQGETTGKVT